MPFTPSLAALELPDDVRAHLTVVSRSRTESKAHVERAQMLLAYAGGEPIRDLARRLQTNRRKVERLVNRALQVGALAALDDLPRSGRPPKITAEARVWLVSVACQEPKALGYSYELWTAELLARHAREQGPEQGHPSLVKLSAGTVSKILRQATVQPPRIAYYLERRDR
jgi:transposase